MTSIKHVHKNLHPNTFPMNSSGDKFNIKMRRDTWWRVFLFLDRCSVKTCSFGLFLLFLYATCSNLINFSKGLFYFSLLLSIYILSVRGSGLTHLLINRPLLYSCDTFFYFAYLSSHLPAKDPLPWRALCRRPLMSDLKSISLSSTFHDLH